MAYALTHAIGEVSDHYFRTGRGVSASSMRAMFERLYRARKSEQAERQAQAGGTLKERLQQLVDAREAGLIDEEEFRARKEQILGAI